MITAKIKLKGLNPQKLIESFDQTATETLAIIKPYANQILKKVVGTQYASLAQLKAMHHPYGFHSQVSPPMPPGYVNVQSGKFYSSIFWEPGISKRRGVASIQVSFDPEKEKFLLPGTSKMIPRPYATLFNILMRDTVTNRMSNLYRTKLKVKLQTYLN